MKELQLNLNSEPNLKILITGLDMFWAIHNYAPYIVCSNETCKLIETLNFKETNTHDTSAGRVGIYHGYQILVDNNLSYGEVKIR